MKAGGARRHAALSPVPLPALPVDVWGCIAHAALAAEGSTMRACVRLSLVCRTWRDCLRGAAVQPCTCSTLQTHWLCARCGSDNGLRCNEQTREKRRLMRS